MPELDVSPIAVVSRLARIRAHIDAELDGVYAAHGLGAASFAVLVTLARIGSERGVSQRRLMEELGLTSGTISVRMDRLAADGVIARRADPDSRRNSLITLTDRGRELFERVAPAHLAAERRMLEALPEPDRERLAGLLRTLLVEFEGARPEPGNPCVLGLRLAPAHVAVAMRESVGLPPTPRLLVLDVDEDGPAAEAGLRRGDMLLRAGRRELRSADALYGALDDARDSGRLGLTVARAGDEHTLALRIPDGALGGAAPAATAGRAPLGEHRV